MDVPVPYQHSRHTRRPMQLLSILEVFLARIYQRSGFQPKISIRSYLSAIRASGSPPEAHTRVWRKRYGRFAMIGKTIFLASEPVVGFSSDWMTFYYQNPAPERFVEEVTALSQQGLLAKREHSGMMAVFLSRVMASNPERIESWMAELSKLPQSGNKTFTRTTPDQWRSLRAPIKVKKQRKMH